MPNVTEPAVAGTMGMRGWVGAWSLAVPWLSGQCRHGALLLVPQQTKHQTHGAEHVGGHVLLHLPAATQQAPLCHSTRASHRPSRSNLHAGLAKHGISTTAVLSTVLVQHHYCPRPCVKVLCWPQLSLELYRPLRCPFSSVRTCTCSPRSVAVTHTSSTAS